MAKEVSKLTNQAGYTEADYEAPDGVLTDTDTVIEATIAGNVNPVEVNLTIKAAPPDVLSILSGATPSVEEGASIPLRVKLVDGQGSPKANTTVAFTVTGGGTLSAPTALTDQQGEATVDYTAAANAGGTQATARASVINVTPVTFTIGVTAAQIITLASLLDSMIDRSRLARSLPYNYKLSEASSSDLRHLDDDKDSTFATNDIFGGNHNLPKEFANNDWSTFKEHQDNRNFATGTDIADARTVTRLIHTRDSAAPDGQPPTDTLYSPKAAGTHRKDVRRYTYVRKKGPGALVWFHWQSIQNWDHQKELKVLIYLDGEADKEEANPGTGVAAIEGSLIDFIGGEKFVPNPLSQHSGGPLIDLSGVSGEWSIADTTRYDTEYDFQYPARGSDQQNAYNSIFRNEEGAFSSLFERRIQCKSHNVYFPITYKEGVLVQLEGVMNVPGHLAATTTDMQDDRMWWCLQDIAFDPGTNVESYSAAVRQTNEQKIIDTAKAIDARTATGVIFTATDNTTLTGAIAPNGEKVLILTGPLSITKLTFKISATDLSQALRSTLLKITFDDGVSGAPQVQAPIGDFFGTAYQISPAHTWNFQVEFDGTMHCAFVMPFQTSAEVKIRNIGVQSVTVETANVHTNPWQWDATSKHFYAQWKIYERLLNWPHRFLDIVRFTGDGVFTGLHKSIYNAPPGYQLTTGWWGEGGKRMTTDREAKPSIYSSGTEESDRYNLSRLNKYSEPQGALPRGDGNDYDPGLSLTSTFDILAPAKCSIELFYEQQWWAWDHKRAHEATRSGRNNTRQPTAPPDLTPDGPPPEGRACYAFVPFWYASPGSTHTMVFDETAAKNEVVQTRDQLYAAPVPATATPKLLDQTINMRPVYLLAEDWEVSSNSGPDVQALRESQLVNGNLLNAGDLGGRSVAIWENTSPTGMITFRFHAWVAGEYDVKVRALKANDAGNFDVSINGGTAVSANLHNDPALDPAKTPPLTIDLGIQSLNSGVNEFTFTCTGGGIPGENKYYLLLDGVDLAIPPASKGFESFDLFALAGSVNGAAAAVPEASSSGALNLAILSGVDFVTSRSYLEPVVFRPTPTGGTNATYLEYTLSNVAQAGTYKIDLIGSKSSDFGTFDIIVNGNNAGKHNENFRADAFAAQNIHIGNHQLNAGNNTLRFSLTGTTGSDDNLIFNGLLATQVRAAASQSFPFHELPNTFLLKHATRPAPARVLENIAAIKTALGADKVVLWENEEAALQWPPTAANESHGRIGYGFGVFAAGNYTVTLKMLRSGDQGIFNIFLNGAQVLTGASGGDGDFYAATDIAYDINLGSQALVQGLNEIIFEVNGHNASSSNYKLILHQIDIAPTA